MRKRRNRCRLGQVEGERIGLGPHERVHHLDSLGPRVVLEPLELGENPLGLLRSPETLKRLELPVIGGEQIRVALDGALKPLERLGAIRLAHALADAVGGVRVGRVGLCDEPEVLLRFVLAAP